jgi:mannose-6-phosphate isomerase-like protein (cupin superfamily)
MGDQIKIIAERIKGLREISGVSVETLARELNVSKELYHQYESGKSDIPVGFLYELAHRHNVELTAILSGVNPRLHVYCVVRKGSGLKVERRKQYRYENLATNFIGKKGEPFLVSADPVPENSQVECNSHPGQEFNYVLEGRLKIIIDGHEVVLDEGDSIYFDSGYDHAMRALDNKPVKFIAFVI